MHKRTLAIVGILLLIMVAVVVAQRARRATPSTHTVTFEASAPKKQVYYCEGITKKGERCKRKVKEPGLMCWQHKPKS